MNQLQQAVTTKRNAASETNKTYLKLRANLNQAIDRRIEGQALEEEESPLKKVDGETGESPLGLKGDLETDKLGEFKEGKTDEADESEDELGDMA